MYSDKNLTCADCGQEFVFTASEQDFYAQRGFTEPRRCPRAAPAARLRGTPRVAAAPTAATAPAAGTPPVGRRLRRRWRRLRLPRSRAARDVRRNLLQLRPRGPGPVPPDQRQARLLQRLLPEHARRLIHILSARADPRPAEPA